MTGGDLTEPCPITSVFASNYISHLNPALLCLLFIPQLRELYRPLCV